VKQAALLVNWFDVAIVNPKGKTTYYSSLITNFTPSRENMGQLRRELDSLNYNKKAKNKVT
jgi:hypothetical protein